MLLILCRCVADEQRTLALGAQSVAFRAFGSIPGPIVFGAIFDSACIYWQYACSRRGNCWVYDNSALSQRAVILAMIGIAANFIFSFLAWLFYPKATKLRTEDLSSPAPLVQSQSSNLGNVSSLHESSHRSSKRMSTSRMDSHCSEDILLESEM